VQLFEVIIQMPPRHQLQVQLQDPVQPGVVVVVVGGAGVVVVLETWHDVLAIWFDADGVYVGWVQAQPWQPLINVHPEPLADQRQLPLQSQFGPEQVVVV
jgi:hypothetical protein